MKSVYSLLLSATYVAAHGYLTQVSIDGMVYPGNVPAASPANPSIIRDISTIDPVKGANNSNLNCGQSAQPGSQVGNANPGSTIAFLWGDGGTHWPHEVGPVMTYMASCGSQTCDQYDPTSAEWFLIDRKGQYPNGTWIQATIMQGNSVSVQIPTNLASGNYMVRNEIIALHNAISPGGAEFYPSCTQIKVGGSQTGQPQKSDLVTFPGSYTDTEAGIYDPNVYNPGSNYTYPGPNPATLVSQDGTTTTGVTTPGDSSSGSGSTGSTTGSTGGTSSGSTTGGSSSSPSTSASSTTPTSSGTCVLRRASSSNSTATNTKRSLARHRRLLKPRSFSRIMRDVIFGEERPLSV